MTNPNILADSGESPSAEFDAARGIVRASVDIAAPPDAVFEALLDPAQLATWWGSDDSYRTHDWDIDAHVGGEWAVHTISTSGDEGTVRGEYLAIDEPRSLEYTWRASWDDFAPTIVRYELTPILIDDTEGTRLDVTHTGFYGFTGCASTGIAQTHKWNGVIVSLAHVGTLYATPELVL